MNSVKKYKNSDNLRAINNLSHDSNDEPKPSFTDSDDEDSIAISDDSYSDNQNNKMNEQLRRWNKEQEILSQTSANRPGRYFNSDQRYALKSPRRNAYRDLQRFNTDEPDDDARPSPIKSYKVTTEDIETPTKSNQPEKIISDTTSDHSHKQRKKKIVPSSPRQSKNLNEDPDPLSNLNCDEITIAFIDNKGTLSRKTNKVCYLDDRGLPDQRKFGSGIWGLSKFRNSIDQDSDSDREEISNTKTKNKQSNTLNESKTPNRERTDEVSNNKSQPKSKRTSNKKSKKSKKSGALDSLKNIKNSIKPAGTKSKPSVTDNSTTSNIKNKPSVTDDLKTPNTKNESSLTPEKIPNTGGKKKRRVRRPKRKTPVKSQDQKGSNQNKEDFSISTQDPVEEQKSSFKIDDLSLLAKTLKTMTVPKDLKSINALKNELSFIMNLVETTERKLFNKNSSESSDGAINTDIFSNVSDNKDEHEIPNNGHVTSSQDKISIPESSITEIKLDENIIFDPDSEEDEDENEDESGPDEINLDESDAEEIHLDQDSVETSTDEDESGPDEINLDETLEEPVPDEDTSDLIKVSIIEPELQEKDSSTEGENIKNTDSPKIWKISLNDRENLSSYSTTTVKEKDIAIDIIADNVSYPLVIYPYGKDTDPKLKLLSFAADSINLDFFTDDGLCEGIAYGEYSNENLSIKVLKFIIYDDNGKETELNTKDLPGKYSIMFEGKLSRSDQ